ncbi:iduronate 2-sulfatase-like [Dreissena polymorpha]|uniref:Sulfatase N-terminal domain-containing protein n=1 Tax=Dreissena polymorpha TaxID=45954 RepID=A0A9D4KMB1_DREPO|nr:iduronate 2-sulfatase-like [Dreissena polymorpha]KAH3842148.1 hypothetical protein DPMN_115642 [Dreissena polymorpha]
MSEIVWFKYGDVRGCSDIAAYGATGDINTTLPDEATRDLRRAYYSAVSYIDDIVGQLVDKTVELGIDQDTVIVFLGDHGLALGELGLWGKNTNFEVATHAPLLIHVPGQTDAGIVSVVEFVDVFPTVVEAAGLATVERCEDGSSESTPLCHEGTSLMPLVSAPETKLKLSAFSQYPRQTDIMGYSIRTDQFRYTEWVQFDNTTNTPDWTVNSGTELYDHDIDPEENYNVHGDSSYAGAEEILQTFLHKGWRDSIILYCDTEHKGFTFDAFWFHFLHHIHA